MSERARMPVHVRLLSSPRSAGGGGGGQAAKDALGNDVKAAEWVKTHAKGDRSLTQGLKVRAHGMHASPRSQPFACVGGARAHVCVLMWRACARSLLARLLLLLHRRPLPFLAGGRPARGPCRQSISGGLKAFWAGAISIGPAS